ncbi:MAG: biopolymer transporter ExbD [Sandaracinus sp.]|nr:biopolymer transporter ExbD [Myxococcales bacterium]MCB9613883.1 biopolymer transporter ExbD [Sandaracinus sp.]
MGLSSHDRDDGIHEINVTPLVDVTLVLLVIFMVTAKLIATPSVPLDLPRAATGDETQTVLTVTVDAEGHRTANGDPIDDDALTELARVELARTPELRAVISASTRASHGDVIDVLDELRRAGLDKVAFAVEPTP